MDHRHDTRNLNGQQREIIRQNDARDKKATEEYEKKKKFKVLKADIVSALQQEETLLSVRDVADKVKATDKDTLEALNALVSEGAVELVVASESPYYKSK